MGSGSTGKATMYENKDRNADYKFIGIELTDEYLPICEARIRYAMNDNSPLEVQARPQIKAEEVEQSGERYERVGWDI